MPGGRDRMGPRAAWSLRHALSATRELVATSPAFACFLLAVLVLPFRWLSPITSIQGHGDWTDALVGLAAVLWLIERLRNHALARAFRRWQLPLAVYLLLAAVSANFAVPGRGAGWSTVLVMTELAVLAMITADFAVEPARRQIIANVIAASALATVALAAIGEVLFYAGVHTGLVGYYGALTPSHLYARLQAGFESPALLGSFCIFASGIVASKDVRLSSRLRVATQTSLALVCAATASRAVLGFLLAIVLRRSATMQGRRRILVPISATIASLAIVAALSVGELDLNPAKPSTIAYVAPAAHQRAEYFRTALKTFEHHPLLGIGTGALPAMDSGELYRAHLTPLNIAATQGLPALITLAVMVWLIWRARRRPTDIPLWSALAGLGLDGLASDIDHYRHVWLLLGLLGSGGGRVAPRREAP